VRFAGAGVACAPLDEAAGAEFASGLAPPPADWNSPLLIEGERRAAERSVMEQLTQFVSQSFQPAEAKAEAARTPPSSPRSLRSSPGSSNLSDGAAWAPKPPAAAATAPASPRDTLAAPAEAAPPPPEQHHGRYTGVFFLLFLDAMQVLVNAHKCTCQPWTNNMIYFVKNQTKLWVFSGISLYYVLLLFWKQKLDDPKLQRIWIFLLSTSLLFTSW
jgi:hypothetical protein